MEREEQVDVAAGVIGATSNIGSAGLNGTMGATGASDFSYPHLAHATGQPPQQPHWL